MDAALLVRECRRRAGFTQAELAQRIGTTQSAIARLESGRVSPTVATLERVGRTCGVRVDFILAAPSGDADLIDERLRMTPRQRLDALLDGLAFERRAQRAKVVGRTADRWPRHG